MSKVGNYNCSHSKERTTPHTSTIFSINKIKLIFFDVMACQKITMLGLRYPTILDDSEGVPKPNMVVGGLNPICEIISFLDRKLARWSSISCFPFIFIEI